MPTKAIPVPIQIDTFSKSKLTGYCWNDDSRLCHRCAIWCSVHPCRSIRSHQHLSTGDWRNSGKKFIGDAILVLNSILILKLSLRKVHTSAGKKRLCFLLSKVKDQKSGFALLIRPNRVCLISRQLWIMWKHLQFFLHSGKWRSQIFFPRRRTIYRNKTGLSR